VLATSVSELGKIVNSDISATEKMKNYILLLTDTYFHHRYLNRLWPHLCMVEDEFSEKLYNEFIIPVKDYMYSILDQGIEAGELGSALTKKAFGVDVLDSSIKDKYAEHLTTTLLSGLTAK